MRHDEIKRRFEIKQERGKGVNSVWMATMSPTRVEESTVKYIRSPKNYVSRILICVSGTLPPYGTA